VVEGQGKYLIGPDNRPIFDTVSGLGANLMDCTNSYSLPSTLEVQVAEELLRRVPFERVKFVKTGSEADQAAVRFMRAATGRTGILRLGYSGWHSEFIGAEEPGLGCPPTDVVKCVSLGEMENVLAVGPSVAGVIMEAVQLDPNVDDALKRIRMACNTTGALLCFDEVITGFRWPKYTVAQTLGVMPDLMTMGKALGGGYPLGCVLGPARIMDMDGVFVSGTFSGETSALRAAQQLMDVVTEDRLRLFWDQANAFQTKLNYNITPAIRAEGYGTRMVLKDDVDGLNVAKLMQEAYRRHRVLFGPVLFPKLTWTAADYTCLLDIITEIVRDLPNITLDGPLPRPVFKR
jgi:glutamate-1-semialdehyde aminotransferase